MRTSSSICGGLLAAAELVAAKATGYIHSEVATRFAPRNNGGKQKFTSTNPYVTTDGSVCTIKAIGQGNDDGPNIAYAFQLCGSEALIDMPGYYTVGTVLNTKLTNVEVRLSGVINYTPDIAYWSPASIYMTYQNATTYWFFSGSGITLHGGGTINGNGQVWWNQFASNSAAGVAGGSSRVFARPIPLTVGNASNVVVDDITILDSPFWHQFVYQSDHILYNNIKVNSTSYNASAPNANSDGWDIYRSSHVTIQNSNINNGDDCVSLKPNSTYVEIYNMICNGSHGISIGSLGQYAGETDIVANVLVKNISMSNAQNGARIKIFGGSNNTKSISGGGSGYVRNVTFQDFYNYKVDNPIYLTSCYSTPTAQCQAFPATLLVSDVHYINVTGTASGVVKNNTVASIECSAICQNITATGTHLTPANAGTPKYLCANLANEALLDFPCTDVQVTKG